MEPVGLTRYDRDRHPIRKSNSPVAIPFKGKRAAYVDLTSDSDEELQVNNMKRQRSSHQVGDLLEVESLGPQEDHHEQQSICPGQQNLDMDRHLPTVPQPEKMVPTSEFLTGSAILKNGHQELDLGWIQLPSTLPQYRPAVQHAPISSQFISREKWILDFKDYISRNFIFPLTDNHCQQAWAYAVKMSYSLLDTYHLRMSNPTMNSEQIQQEYERQLLSIAGEVCVQIHNREEYAYASRFPQPLCLI